MIVKHQARISEVYQQIDDHNHHAISCYLLCYIVDQHILSHTHKKAINKIASLSCHELSEMVKKYGKNKSKSNKEFILATQEITLNESMFVFETVMRVRYTEIDVGQFLTMPAMCALLTEAKARYFYSRGIKDVNADYQGPIMTDLQLNFPTRIKSREELLFEVGVDGINKHTANLIFKVSRMYDGSLVAKAQANIVNFDYRKNQITPFSDELMQALFHEPFEV